MRRPPHPERIRRQVVLALIAATLWLGAVLLAWQRNQWPNRILAVPIALAPFVLILVWSWSRPPR